MNYKSYKKWLQLFIVLLLGGLLVGCSGCVEPDDFGYGQSYLNISSNPSGAMIHAPQVSGTQFVAEYVDWKDTGLVTNGQSILLTVLNNVDTNCTNNSCRLYDNTIFSPSRSWTAWFGNYQQQQNQFFYTTPCCFADPCAISATFPPVTNPPCVFSQGQGALALLIPANAKNPNTINGAQPNGNTYHLAVGNTCAGTQDSQISDSGAIAGGLYLNTVPSICNVQGGCKLYVKMIDQLYEDNYGSYTVAAKSGFDTTTLGPLASLVTIVQKNLCQATVVIYKNLLPYLGYIRVLLILYVAFSAVGFLIGTVEITQRELLMRIFKMALVIQISTTGSSWSFFNNYFFSFFTNGISEVLSMMLGSTSAAVGGADQCVQDISGFSKLDGIIHMFFSTSTLYKVTSLVFTSFAGFVFFPVFYAVAVLAAYAMVKAVITYLVCYTIISLLIILAPIFIPFILFKLTKSIFDTWLKYLMSFFIQPIVIMAFAFFICDLVLNQMYYILGFRACYNKVATVIVGIYLWQPDNPSSTKLDNMVVPGRICEPCGADSFPLCQCTENSPATCSEPVNPCCSSTIDNCTTGFCAPYACSGDRYVDAPYLDPSSNSDMSKFQSMQGGDYVSFLDVAVFALLAWVMFRLIDIIPVVAKQLAGTPQSMTSVASVGNAIAGNVWSMAKDVANTTISQGMTTLARGANAIKAYKTSRREGVGRFAAFENSMAAGYDTKSIDVGKNISKKLTSIKEGLQDKIGSKVEGAQELANAGLKTLKPLGNPLGLVARGTARVLTKAVIPAAAQTLTFLGKTTSFAVKKAFSSVRKSTAAPAGMVFYTSAGTEGRYAGEPTYMESIKSGSRAATAATDKLNKGLTYFIGEYKRKVGPDGKKIGLLPELVEAKSKSDLRSGLRNLANFSAADKSSKLLNKATSKLGDSKAAKLVTGAGSLAARTLLSAPLLSGALRGIANSLDTDEEKKWRKENTVNTLHSYQDKVGGLIENFMESKAAKYSHAIFSLTGGAFGQDANEALDSSGMSRADYIRAQHEKNLKNWEGGLINTNTAAWNNKWGLKMAKAVNFIPASMNRSSADQKLFGPGILRKVSGIKTIDEDYKS